MLAVKLILVLTTYFCSAFAQHKPNVVFILADDLGWGDISLHGSDQIATPNIVALASDGVVLNNYYVQPLCSPTRSALLTGRFPWHLGLQQGVISKGQPYGLPLTVQTMPQLMRQLGYATVGVGKWHLGFHRKSFIPTSRGFDSFFGYWAGAQDYFNRKAGKGIDFHFNEKNLNTSIYKNWYSPDMYTDVIVKAISNHSKVMNEQKSIDKRQPLFLYYAPQSVHGPLQTTDKYKNRFGHIKDGDRRTFAGMVSALDDSIGRLVEALDKSGMLNNTLLVFSTDNGGAVNEGRSGVRTNFPLRGNKNSLWEGGTRGNAFIWSKKLLQNKKYVSQQMMHVVDWLPTVYSAVGGDASDLIPLDGLDMWQSLKNNRSSPRTSFVYNIRDYSPGHNNWAVRLGRYKLMKMGQFDKQHNEVYRPFGQNDSVHYPKNITDWTPDPVESPAGRALAKLNGHKVKPIKVLVECGHHKGKTNCVNKTMCLFDIDDDPCEFNDISQQRPKIVKQLLDLKDNFNASAVNPRVKKFDPRSEPKLHNGYWTYWLD